MMAPSRLRRLTCNSSLVQMMRAEAGHSDETRERLNLISAQIDRINQVTKDMTNFARSRPAAKRDVDINAIVSTAIRLANFDKVFQSLNIERKLADDLPMVFADDDQLQQVFLNLLLNARDAMPDGGSLTIQSLLAGDHVTVEIADSGTGIDITEAKQIFDPFFTTKPAGKGTGLGLAVCYGIVTAHDGRIEVAQNEPKGTIFRVILPVSG